MTNHKMKLFKCLWIMESIFNYLKKEGAASTLFFNYGHINLEITYLAVEMKNIRDNVP